MLVPLELWNTIHNRHHAHSGNLDERSILDVITLTLDEYRHLPWMKRFAYRIFRSAVFQLLIYQQSVFIIGFRIPFVFFTKKGQWAIIQNNILYVGLGILLFPVVSFSVLAISVLPVYLITFGIGSHIFFIQHQMEEAYWKETGQHDFVKAGIEGSTFWNLPKWGHWITGNIGYHHIHHLNLGIPNYQLASAHEAIEQEVEDKLLKVDFWQGFLAYRYKIFDKNTRKMIPFPRAF